MRPASISRWLVLVVVAAAVVVGGTSAAVRGGETAASVAFTFSDGFESGDLSQWTSASGVVVQQQEVFGGSWAARATTTSAAAWAYKQFSADQTRVYFGARFKIVSQSATTVNLMRLRTATGTSIVRVYLTSTSKLATRNDVTGITTSSSTPASIGSWHLLELRLVVDSVDGQIEVVLDGARVAVLSKADSFGTTAVGRAIFGDEGTGKAFDIVYDDIVVATLPAVVTAPTIAGTAEAGQTLTADRGSWSGSEPLAYAYQWRRCDANGANCTDIAGATTSQYTLTGADVGGTIRVSVTASNVGGSATAASAATSVVASAPQVAPTNTDPPSIAGTAQEGQTLTASPGTWSGTQPISYGYQWQRCDSGGGGCADIAGATASSYVLATADVGATIRVSVTATNGAGSATAISAATDVVTAAAGAAPANTAPPSISGSTQDGQTLTASPGTWSGTQPISYGYQWRRCDSGGGGCVDVAGATSSSYVLTSTDVGARLRVAVTATNSVGAGTATSSATAVVVAAAPQSTAAPSIAGTAQDGQTLTASPGTWSGTQPLTYVYQWKRCDSGGAGCVNIAGATASSYVLATADVGATIRVAVTATNSAGSATATSPATAVVARAPAAPGDVGYEDGSFTGTSSPTGTKRAESSLWWNDGLWWANMWDTASNDFHIFKLDVATQTWRDTGVTVDKRGSTHADTLWDGTHLYVASHIGLADLTAAVSGYPSYLYRFSYDSAAHKYTLDSGFPVTINNYKTETLAIDKDSTGKLWATWQQDNKIYVNRTVGDDRTWGTPFVLPVATDVTVDDNSSVIAFGGNKIGVMWSNQSSANTGMWFAVHNDGDADTTWQASRAAIQGKNTADDHINLKADSSGRVYAATKTSQTLSSPLIMLLVRDAGSGDWASYVFGRGSDCHNRPIVLIDEGARVIHMFATGPAPPDYSCKESGGTIYEKTSSLDAISLPPGYGTPVMVDADSAVISNASSTKQNVASATGLVVLAANATTKRYWHNYDDLPPGSSAIPPANTVPPSITGTAREAETLAADQGTWTGTEPLSYAYQWRRCTLAGDPCADIAGATSSTYTIVGTDVGATIRVTVTATDNAGSAAASSSATAVVSALPFPSGDPVVAAAGDIACDPASTSFKKGNGTAAACRQKYTSDLLVNAGLSAVLALGDNQSDCGGYDAYLRSYDLSWGRVKTLTKPTVGEQEYLTSGGTGCDASGSAAGYFQYFGAAAGEPGKGYYSYDIGAWHVIALNSNCTNIGGCGTGSPQETWLKADLAAHPSQCTLAYYHHPRFASNGDTLGVNQLWYDLVTAGADVVLNSHRRHYERFAPQGAGGTYDPVGGVREFVVGTGGKSLTKFGTTFETNSEVRNDATFGVVKLTLHPAGYEWQFVPEAGKTFTDAGSAYCH
jgi:hypothetical protein